MSTDTDPKRALSNLKKRRGVAKASISRLENKSRELERDHDLPATKNAARQMLTKLQEATTGFRQVHLSIVDLFLKRKETWKWNKLSLMNIMTLCQQSHSA